MPKYDYMMTGAGITRFANDCSLDALLSHITSDLRYNIKGATDITIEIKQKRGKAKYGY